MHCTGGYPSFSLTRGFVTDPADLCTRSMLNLLSTMPRDASKPQPKTILLSSTGLHKAARAVLPLPYKPLYKLMKVPHDDKLGMERVVAYAAGWTWIGDEPGPHVLPVGWQARFPQAGFLQSQSALILQAALLTDGACKADDAGLAGKAIYRAEDRDITGAYTISRRDVAHFIAEDALKHWDKWGGKVVRIAY